MPITIPKGYRMKSYVVKEATHNRLVKLANKEGRTLAWIVEDALSSYVGVKPKAAKKAAKKAPKKAAKKATRK